MNKPKNVVIIGGGHGQSAICRGIKNIENLKISAIVTVADDGGSTGRLRKRFHIPAMGDIRNVMIALAESESLMGNLMDYRFEDTDGDESDVGGHNLGNLILTALTQQCGSFMEAVQTIGKVLNVKGNIIPATTQVITLYAMMDDGVIVKGEANIPTRHNRIRKVFYQEPVHAVPEAVAALKNADLIIYGIGSVYTSILPNIIIDEMRDALNASKAKKVYFCNAMTQPGETDGFSLEDHVEALKSHGAPVDEVVFASDSLPEKLIARYAEEGSIPVIENTCSHSYKVRHENLLNFSSNLIRHDSLKIERAVRKLVEEL
ncbi:MAG: uridine diphosphate-N-acetylglucosamine-binding protein YvcK [Erysipelotrichaceae bacterium]|nr:uridine diphosphate-N-acetylglucosamine-binding protein YvcK [Erysipelotrichaceae bacterium]